MGWKSTRSTNASRRRSTPPPRRAGGARVRVDAPGARGGVRTGAGLARPARGRRGVEVFVVSVARRGGGDRGDRASGGDAQVFGARGGGNLDASGGGGGGVGDRDGDRARAVHLGRRARGARHIGDVDPAERGETGVTARIRRRHGTLRRHRRGGQREGTRSGIVRPRRQRQTHGVTSETTGSSHTTARFGRSNR